jgi:hypothetical protein
MNISDAVMVAEMEAEQTGKWNAMCDHPEVVELTEQLYNGLIHPLEYADAVKAHAVKAGIYWHMAPGAA